MDLCRESSCCVGDDVVEFENYKFEYTNETDVIEFENYKIEYPDETEYEDYEIEYEIPEFIEFDNYTTEDDISDITEDDYSDESRTYTLKEFNKKFGMIRIVCEYCGEEIMNYGNISCSNCY